MKYSLSVAGRWKFQKLSVTGGIVNAYEAMKLAESRLK